MTRYAIALGSNVGDRLGHLADAAGVLSERLGRVSASSLYETMPVGGPEQDPFLNAVVVVESDLEAVQVLEICQEIEHAHERERQQRWGPRTLDLDIVTSDGPEHDDEQLTIPHPRAGEREFVLRPLCDVWPDAPVGEGMTALSALERVGDQGVDYLTNDWIPPVSRWKSNTLLAGQAVIFAAAAIAFVADGNLPRAWVPVRVVGLVMALAGVGLALEAARRLGDSMTASPVPRSGARLVVSGPFRYARHPIYGGVCLFLIGTALTLGSGVGLAVSATLVPYFLFKARYEERQLRMRFAGYLDYTRRVRKRLIPFVV